MTITTVTTLSHLASTTVAAYGDLPNDNQLKDWLTDAEGNANFTETQADAFVAKYRLLHQQPNIAGNGFSATVFEDKETGKRIIAMRGTELNSAGQIVIDGVVTDIMSIGGNGFANNQAVEMYRYYKRLITVSGEAVDYSDQEKWQLFAMKHSLEVPLAVVMPALVPSSSLL